MVTPMVVNPSVPHMEPKAVVRDATFRSEGSVAVVLHPLVVINISDHYTRFAAMRMFPEAAARNACSNPALAAQPLTDAEGNTKVIGILLGEQEGRTVEVCHSFELPGLISEVGNTNVDVEFMQKRIEQYKQIFPSYAVVGWYSTTARVTEDDLRLHTEVFSVLNESPVLLVINPKECTNAFGDRNVTNAGSSSSAPPRGRLRGQAPGAIVAYQAELHMVGDVLTTMLAPVAHSFASADSERIAVDHVTRHAVPGGGDAVSSTAVHLATLRRSICMLKSRVDVLVRFLQATASGEIPKDHELLRKVFGVCARLPAMNSPQFSRAFQGEYHDSMVVSYLSGVTKSLCALNDLVAKFNFAYERSSTSDVRRRSGFLL